MTSGRRNFIKSSLTCALSLGLAKIALGEIKPSRELPRPDPTLFQSGDLVWPKKPGVYVPYNSGSRNAPSEDRDQWESEKKAYLAKHKTPPQTELLLRRRIATLQNMDFREFLAVYAGGQTPGVPGLYSGGIAYVGHVGIIEVDSDGKSWVIEALLGDIKKVVRQEYTTWINGRSDQVVWLGRLREVPSEARAKVAEEAKRYINKPYDFWNFDLNDDAGFYCSKLVWLSIYRSLKFSVDGDDDTNRLLWFSPKQLMYAPTIELLHDPGPYATR